MVHCTTVLMHACIWCISRLIHYSMIFSDYYFFLSDLAFVAFIKPLWLVFSRLCGASLSLRGIFIAFVARFSFISYPKIII